MGKALAVVAGLAGLAPGAKASNPSDHFVRVSPSSGVSVEDAAPILQPLQPGFSVDDLSRRLRIFTTRQQLSCKERTDELFQLPDAQPASESQKRLIAAELHRYLRNRPDLVERYMVNPNPEDPEGFYKLPMVVYLSEAQGENCKEEGGIHHTQDGRPIVFLYGNSPSLGADPKECSSNAGHEGVHVLNGDGAAKKIRADGTFPEMTDEQIKRMDAATQALIDKFLRTYADGARFKYRGAEHQSIPGIRDYAFKDVFKYRRAPWRAYPELRAETVASFTTCPQLFYEANPELYGVYRDYFEVDPRNDSPPAMARER